MVKVNAELDGLEVQVMHLVMLLSAEPTQPVATGMHLQDTSGLRKLPVKKAWYVSLVTSCMW